EDTPIDWMTIQGRPPNFLIPIASLRTDWSGQRHSNGMKTLFKVGREKLQTLLPFKVAAVIFAVVVLFGRAEGATLNIQSYGATPNDGSDDATAINNAMNASAVGDTILFPAGVYNISSTLTLKSDRNYSGAGATLKRSGTDVFAVQTEWDNGKNVLIDGLTLDSGGVSFAGSGNVRANNVDIRNATFKNIVHVTYPYNTGIY